jgi:hypothetical protein
VAVEGAKPVRVLSVQPAFPGAIWYSPYVAAETAPDEVSVSVASLVTVIPAKPLKSKRKRDRVLELDVAARIVVDPPSLDLIHTAGKRLSAVGAA